MGENEDQLIVGYLGCTRNVHDRIIQVMEEQEVTWTMMAKELGCSRQALVASLKRRHVQYPRMFRVCRYLANVRKGKLPESELLTLTGQISDQYVDSVFDLTANSRLI